MSKIKHVFDELKDKRAAFIPYFVLGLPDINKSVEHIISCSEYYDILELGIPFTDPVADGPTIQEGSQIALQNNYSMDDYFETTKRIVKEINKPVVFMLYYNQVFGYGLEKFMKKAKDAGVCGLIIPDLLPDSDKDLNEHAKKAGIDTIFLTTPLTKRNRLEKIIDETSGFLYVTALVGITGERSDVNEELENFVKKIKKQTDLPLSVGFGISKPEHVKNISVFADGVIVGSAIVRKIIKGENPLNFVKELFSALN